MAQTISLSIYSITINKRGNRDELQAIMPSVDVGNSPR